METTTSQERKKSAGPEFESLFSTIFTQAIMEEIFNNPTNGIFPRGVTLMAQEKVPVKDLNYYVEKVGERAGWKYQKTQNLLNTLDELYPIIPFSLILREIAVDLDKQYVDHIEDSFEIFVISTVNGKITQADKSYITSYRNFAAFRTIEDAKFACHILSPIMKEIFQNGRGK